MNTVTERPLVFIRASSLSTLFDCAHRWEGEHLLGMRGPRSAPAQLGTAVHAGTAVFDASRLPGAAPVSADDAADAVVKAIHEPEEDVAWVDMPARTAEKIALALHTKYCADVAPKQTYLAVEAKCERLDLPDLGIALGGTTDRIRVTAGGRNGITDLKTGKRAVGADGKPEVKKHAIQLGVYELLAEHTAGVSITAPAQIVGMNTGETPATQRVGLGEVRDARAALVGTEEEPGFLQQAAHIVASGNFPANPNSFLCSPKFCARFASCRYHR
jgi:RecB family exonuclease